MDCNLHFFDFNPGPGRFDQDLHLKGKSFVVEL